MSKKIWELMQKQNTFLYDSFSTDTNNVQG